MKLLTLIKIGALGDVVRTSYLVNALKRKFNYSIIWITDKSSHELLKYNPNIDTLLYQDSELPKETDILICLEDQYEYVKLGKQIKSKKNIGSYIDDNNTVKYTDDTKEWFDMSLISRFGKSEADNLKKNNSKSFNEIFSKILNIQISDIKPEFFNYKNYKNQSLKNNKLDKVIGLNLFAGKRWPSKEISIDNIINLIACISKYLDSKKMNYSFFVFCDNSNQERADSIILSNRKVIKMNTSSSVLDFSNAIKTCDYVITTDSLGMHLAIANKINHLSFFSPTSANEIDSFGYAKKVISTSDDYCTYKPYTDNSSLSYNRLFKSWCEHMKELGYEK